MFAVCVTSNLEQRNNHGENHPDVDHFDIRRRRKGTSYANVAAKSSVRSFVLFVIYSQCCQDKESGEVDANNHVKIVYIEDIDQMADEKENDAGDEDYENVTKKGTAKSDSYLDTCVSPQLYVTHYIVLHHIFCQILGTNIGQVPPKKCCKIDLSFQRPELHFALLRVKGIPLQIKVAPPNRGKVFATEVSVLPSRIYESIVQTCCLNLVKLVFSISFKVVLTAPNHF